MKMIFWQGEHVKLRGVEPRDSVLFYESLYDTNIQRFVSDIRVPVSMKYCEDWAEEESSKGNSDLEGFFIIEDLQGNSVGMVDPHDVDSRLKCFSCGIWIKPEYQRRGYAWEAVHLILRFFFMEQNYEKFNAGAYGNNQSSLTLLHKLGAKQEGEIRMNAYTDGQYYSEFLFGMTKEEYLAHIK